MIGISNLVVATSIKYRCIDTVIINCKKYTAHKHRALFMHKRSKLNSGWSYEIGLDFWICSIGSYRKITITNCTCYTAQNKL